MSVPMFNMIVAICMMVIAVFVAAWAIGMLIAVFKIKGILHQTMNKAQPAIAKAEDAVGTVNGMIHSVQQRVEDITNTAQDTADAVSRRVKGTTEVITETAASPSIILAGLMAGVAKGLDVFSNLQRSRRGGMKRAA